MSDKPTQADWQARAAKEVKGRDLTWHLPEGFAIQPLYTSADAPAEPVLPGFAPFTRGPYASMYAGRPWTVRRSTKSVYRISRTRTAAPAAGFSQTHPP